MSDLTKAAQDVLAERQRQIEVEGWTLAHDDQHLDGELPTLAAMYALGGSPAWVEGAVGIHDWYRPKDVRRDLVKAGALILAEIERLDRMAAPPDSAGDARNSPFGASARDAGLEEK